MYLDSALRPENCSGHLPVRLWMFCLRPVGQRFLPGYNSWGSSLFFRSHKTSASEGETSEADGVRGHRAQNWWIGMCRDLLWGEEKETAHGWKEGRRNNFFVPLRGNRTFWTSHHPEKFPANQILFLDYSLHKRFLWQSFFTKQKVPPEVNHHSWCFLYINLTFLRLCFLAFFFFASIIIWINQRNICSLLKC